MSLLEVMKYWSLTYCYVALVGYFQVQHLAGRQNSGELLTATTQGQYDLCHCQRPVQMLPQRKSSARSSDVLVQIYLAEAAEEESRSR
jgi:hypothetical protein